MNKSLFGFHVEFNDQHVRLDSRVRVVSGLNKLPSKNEAGETPARAKESESEKCDSAFYIIPVAGENPKQIILETDLPSSPHPEPEAKFQTLNFCAISLDAEGQFCSTQCSQPQTIDKCSWQKELQKKEVVVLLFNE